MDIILILMMIKCNIRKEVNKKLKVRKKWVLTVKRLVELWKEFKD